MTEQALAIDVPLAEIAEFCRRYHVRELSLFGSTLGKDFRPDSDIDLLVEFEPETRVGFLLLGRMERELGELFGRKVDLVPKNGLKPLIRQAVLDSAQILYAA